MVMAHFTVRIELHDAQWSDYEKLHGAMEQNGFSRLIVANDGVSYRLPWAEYNGHGNLTCVQVRDIAQRVANQTGKRNSIFVTEAVRRAWSGLQVA